MWLGEGVDVWGVCTNNVFILIAHLPPQPHVGKVSSGFPFLGKYAPTDLYQKGY
jgi:hypothetical protein